jgi:hypothetical protein
MKQIFTTILALCLFLLSTAQVVLTGNPIVTENALPGSPISEWGVPNFRDNRIAGFSTKMSLNSGETVRFKINVQGGTNYTLKIYRIGYYGGNGARLKHDFGTLSGTVQPPGISDPSLGLLDCSNWSESASWAIPANAVSGLYIAKLERLAGGSNHIVFIVRNDNSNSDLYLQFPDARWQAYNGYGGNSTYDGNVPGAQQGHASKVSYNRPFFQYNSLFNTDGKGADWYMNNEYPMIRWLERNGYDVTYTSSNDVANNGSRLLNHKVFISIGHDEYWSKEQRNNVEAARDQGVHLAFFSGNEVYWKIRWEGNDGSEDRTMVCYKEGFLGNGGLGERTCGGKCDGTSSEWTGLWRTGGDYDAGKPENALTGQISWTEGVDQPIKVPSYYKNLRFWRNTVVASLANGQTASLGDRVLGYEWDFEQYHKDYPHGRITMSSTVTNDLVNPGVRTHKLSLYRHASGALVFGAGTVQWSWGLDDQHWGAATTASRDLQQATVNLFADMGVQPETLQGDLVTALASTDNIPPTSVISFPSNGASFPARSTVTITGTATDGAVVAGLEVSVDGGATWDVATTVSDLDGTVTWTYVWKPEVQGNINIKTRGFDDSGNIETAGPGITVTILTPVCPCTIFPESEEPADKWIDNPLELGVKFKANTGGSITGIRFYKDPNDMGTHTGSLWTANGTLLGQVVFTNETATGWQQATFASPIPITAGTTYIASYYNPTGNFRFTRNFFGQDYPLGPSSSWQLQALKSNYINHPFDDGNGVYDYGNGPVFPQFASNSDNYMVDVVFNTGSTLPVTLLSISATAKDNSIKLNWATSTEINNSGFEIQRSVNGTSWSVIGFVNGAGNSTSVLNYSFTDENLAPHRYYYRLKQIDIDQRFVYSPVVSAIVDGTETFSLEQNYPNPFRNETIIKFTLPRSGKVNLSLFDMNGRLVKVLVNETKESGAHAVNLNSAMLSSGLYYYKLQTGDNSAVKKLTIQ